MTNPHMTAAKFREYLELLRYSQRAFAELIEVDPKTVQRWATGRNQVPGAVALLLPLLMGTEPQQRLSRQSGFKLIDNYRFLYGTNNRGMTEAVDLFTRRQ